MAGPEKLVFMVTHGPAEPELATIPFVMAAAALASDVAVVMGCCSCAARASKAEGSRQPTWSTAPRWSPPPGSSRRSRPPPTP